MATKGSMRADTWMWKVRPIPMKISVAMMSEPLRVTKKLFDQTNQVCACVRDVCEDGGWKSVHIASRQKVVQADGKLPILSKHFNFQKGGRTNLL
jgi:hypothetical protein